MKSGEEIKVTVIVPVYNVESYIRQCLDSLLNQTLRNIEIIVVDDGSPDNCAQIVDEYAISDNRIKVIHKKNGGVSAARNDGIERITGKYIFFCDSDDWLTEDALEKMFKRAEDSRSDVLISDFYEAVEDEYIIKKMFSNEFVTDDIETLRTLQNTVLPKGVTALRCKDFKRGYCLGAPWHHLIRSSIIIDNNLRYDTYVRGIFDDGLFMLNVFEHAKRVAYLSENTYYYRIVSGSLTHRFNPAILDTYARVYERLEEFGKMYHKDSSYYDAYYIRVIGYLNKAMSICFLNPENKDIEKVRYEKFIDMVNSEPYAKAIRSVKLGGIYHFKTKLLISLLRTKQYKLYWEIKKKILKRN